MKYDPSILVRPNPARSGKSVVGWLVKHRWFLLFVGLPVLLATIYYGLIASDEYVSESRFVIKSPSQRQAQLSTLANLIQTTGLSTGQEQSNEVIDYIRSRNALVDLQKKIDVKKSFSLPSIDFLSRFPSVFSKDSFESLYRYYGSKVSGRFDTETGAAVLQVKAFTPDDAYRINARLLEQSEALVNRLNDRAQKMGIAEAERRVVDAQKRAREARAAMGAYRTSEELVDPAKQAVGVLDISNKMVAEQAALRAQLESMERNAPANPSIPALRSRVAAIGRAIGAQEGRVVGRRNGMASKIGGYESRLVEQEFATQMLNAASANLESARSDAQKQQFYLEMVVAPNRPDMALLPQRLKGILVFAGAALCLYLIGWMVVIGILEHAPDN